MDAKTQRGIVDDWIRGMTILADGSHRPINELLAEIATVNDTGPLGIKLVSPLMPGESRDLQETIRAQNRLRGRETMVHAIITQILLRWCAEASGQTRSDIIQRLALTLNDWLNGADPPSGQA